jgi:hypothetical protein
MHKTVLLLPILAVTAGLTGCVGSGPSTEQGAVTGGALGAVAGAIIGHNSGSNDAVGGAVLGGLAGAVAGGVIGNSVDQEHGTIYGSQSVVANNPDSREYRVARAETVMAPPAPPPTPAEVRPPMPAANAVWAAGYWIYDGRTYTWTSGHWEIPPPYAHTYIPAHSENRNGQMVFVQGYWQ